MKKLIKRTSKYTLFAVLGFLIDIAVIYLLVEYLATYYLLAIIIGFVAGHSTSYTMNKRHNFRDSRNSIKKSYSYYIFFGIITIFLITFLVYISVDFFGLNYLYSRIIIGLILSIIFYIINSKIAFGVDIFS